MAEQHSLTNDDIYLVENEDYLTQQLITYIGNKRSLLTFIGDGVYEVTRKLGKKKLDVFDVFSGSGAVARYFKQFSQKLYVNDIETYAHVINECYLANRSEIDDAHLRTVYIELKNKLNTKELREGFISELYAPKNDKEIKIGERVFYTTRNAKYIDTARQYIEEIDQNDRRYFLAPLLSEASIHANTSGVFKGFYKDRESGIGEFGGKNQDALYRIKGDIDLPYPVFSNFECEVDIHRGDANQIAESIPEVDIAYLDPPYNQHPYGSNYFMLNLIVDYIRPRNISKVSGIPEDWYRSDYNKSKQAKIVLEDLVKKVKAKFLMVSFNSEGFISKDEMKCILEKIGKVNILERKYNAFRGSRNLNDRNIHVKEYLFLVEKK